VLDVDYLPQVEGVQPATQIDFGGGDVLTLVGVSKSDLNIQSGLITFVETT
jgi:hypothetical protein